MALSRELALESDQIEEIMTSEWNLRIATHSPQDRINLTPMWFAWVNGCIYIYGRGQKIRNLRRNPQCTVIVDRNTKFPELQGLMFQGRATILEDAAAEDADPHLNEARVQMGRKYNGGHGRPPVDDPPPNDFSAGGSSRRWFIVEPEHKVTWDNFKLGRLTRRG
ncbi:MAG: pyridoxamine 5'-phosphate oxidase family protein [bacterium]|nr:pyridoxamine 5'-phosphate oxidase family protein [bacterium]